METAVGRQPFYALGHSEQELQRLSRQGQALGPFTRQLFQEAGIREGMRVLDVGCGGGDVAFLAADLVGPSGVVMGVDRERRAVDWANARAHSQGTTNVNFVEGDPAEMEFDHQFDAVVGRLVLMYYPDPVDTIRKLMRHLRPEGLIVFQEMDMANARSLPVAPVFERSLTWMKQTLNATGARIQLGLELYPVFLAAGLPGPSMRVDALIGGGPQCPGYEIVADVVQSLLPAMEKLKIASAAEVGISTLAQRMRDEVVALKGVVVSAGFIGAWSHKQRSD
jgi:2-polyprenyl-3-methyl-5-hydroxy-6-metoxy-1,4-benzoquinol methylase